ncbi:hypothetical protein H5P36_18990 [Bacillus sp. APMAM]|nr:hypothetical protein [Bacillus sp. APMAM]
MEEWRVEEILRIKYPFQRLGFKKHDYTSKTNRFSSKFKEDSKHTIL